MPAGGFSAVTAVARRIAALLLLGPDLDASYRRTNDNSYSWPP